VKVAGMTPRSNRRFWLGRVLDIWRVAYGAETRRCLGSSIIAVPLALRGVLRAGTRRPGQVHAVARALLAVPIGIASSVLTAVLAFFTLINVLAYPFRPYLGLPGNGGDIWASRYADSWGGPTLAGAWTVHAGLVLLIVVPVLAWAVRGLTGVQRSLTATGPSQIPAAPASAPAGSPPTPTDSGPIAAAAPAGRRRRRTPAAGTGPTRRRGAAIGAATALFVAFSLTAHWAGIGDNLLWTPRDLASTAGLAVTLAPVAGLVLITRTGWWREVGRRSVRPDRRP
jgi:hypothetical protein